MSPRCRSNAIIQRPSASNSRSGPPKLSLMIPPSPRRPSSPAPVYRPVPHNNPSDQYQHQYQSIPQPLPQSHQSLSSPPHHTTTSASSPPNDDRNAKLLACTLLKRHSPQRQAGACPWGALRAACGAKRYVGTPLRVEVA